MVDAKLISSTQPSFFTLNRCVLTLLFLGFNLFFYSTMGWVAQHSLQLFYILFVLGLCMLHWMFCMRSEITQSFYLSILAFDFFYADIFGVLTLMLVIYTCFCRRILDQFFSDTIPSMLWLFCALLLSWFAILPAVDIIMLQVIRCLISWNMISY